METCDNYGFKEAFLQGRSLLTLNDLSDKEMMDLLDLAIGLKKKKQMKAKGSLLCGRNIALIFEKMSTRTRCATTVAVADEGGNAEYLSANEIHIGKKESVADTARVLGRMFDGILFRGYKQDTVKQMAQYSGVPVWNGLTDEAHPTQALADLMTIKEHFGRLKGLKAVYVGDGRNNVAMSLMLGCAKAGMHFVDCTPPELYPASEDIKDVQKKASENGGSVVVDSDISTAVAGANVICTDVWFSMGEESKQAQRIKLLRPYQVDMNLIKQTGNMENGNLIFLHCLPAFHDNKTEATRDTGALEVTDEVFQAPFSRAFDEAENRMHTIKALLAAVLGS